MSDFKKFNIIVCVSCGSNKWKVALGNHRVIMNCPQCEYRYSLPLDEIALNAPHYKTMPLEFDKTKKLRD